MLRITSAVVIGLALACAFTLYTVSYDTRELDQLVQSKERRIERLRSDIAVLRAELAYLSRPERIEPLARAMGFEPAKGEQYVEPEKLAGGTSVQGDTPGDARRAATAPSQQQPERR